MTAAVRLAGVEVVRGGRRILGPVDLVLDHGEHCVVLGPNGSGKTTLLSVLSTHLHPTRGDVEVLGAAFGRVDLRALRGQVAVVSTGVDRLLHRLCPARELVAAARHGAMRPDPAVTEDDRRRAEAALARVGAVRLVDQPTRTCSQGEWQRVKLARALVTEPELLLLDEPFAGLDLGGREALVGDLAAVMDEPDGPTVVLVTHHVEEVPDTVRHALLLGDGGVVAHGPAADVLTGELVGRAFGVAVDVDRDHGRYRARVRRR